MIARYATTIAFLLFVSATCQIMARPLLNEVHLNPPGGDDEAFQYLEILTVNDAGAPVQETIGEVSVIIVDSNGAKTGAIEEVLSLKDLTTGTNGLLLIGKGFDRQVPWSVPAETAVADFVALASGEGSGSLGPKNGVSVLLVSNLLGGPSLDLDESDSGALEEGHWSGIVDSISFGDRPYGAALDIKFAPGNLSRTLGEVSPNAVEAWHGGSIAEIDGPLDLGYGEAFFGLVSFASPGRSNEGKNSENLIRINEVLINPPGADRNVEFVELISTSGTTTSTNGLWLLVIDSNGDGNAVGEVLEAWDLSNQATGRNGLMVLGNNYERHRGPWRGLAESETVLYDPQGMGDETLPNSGISLLLVKDFTGSVRTDAAVGTDLDPNDDYQIDIRPWDTKGGNGGLLDSVGYSEITAVGGIAGPSYALADVTQLKEGGYHPDAIFRSPHNLKSNDTSAWLGGNMGGDTGTGIAFQTKRHFGPYLGYVSPGRPNPGAEALPSPVLLSEVVLDPIASPDHNFEYIEIISPSRTFTPLIDMHLLFIDVSGLQKGAIRNVVDLRGLTTGRDGVLLLGDSYNDQNPYGYFPGAHLEDPPGLNLGEIGPDDNKSIAVLIVSGFSGTEGMDIDLDDNGSFDVFPWSGIMDAVGFGVGLVDDTHLANLNEVPFTPDALCRVPGNDVPFAKNAWYGGRFDPDNPLDFIESFGPFRGAASPGEVNLAGPRRSAPMVINEVYLDPPGVDDDREFIELASGSGGRQSTNGLSLLVLDSSGAKTGEVLEAWNLDGMATGTNGILLLGQNYASSDGARGYWDRTLFAGNPHTPFGPTIDEGVGALGSPIGMEGGDLGDNEAFSLLLVEGFTGSPGQDLDADDDGQLDTPFPWSTERGANGILDSVGFCERDAATSKPKGRLYTLADLGTIPSDNTNNQASGGITTDRFSSIELQTEDKQWVLTARFTLDALPMLPESGSGSDAIRVGFFDSATSNGFFAELDLQNFSFGKLPAVTPKLELREDKDSNASVFSGEIPRVAKSSGVNLPSSAYEIRTDGADEVRSLLKDTGEEYQIVVTLSSIESTSAGLMAEVKRGDEVIVSQGPLTVQLSMTPDAWGIRNENGELISGALSTTPSGEVPSGGSGGTGSTVAYLPDTFARVGGNLTPNDAAAWSGAEMLEGASGNVLVYGANTFGPLKGVTPGLPNNGLLPGSSRVDQDGDGMTDAEELLAGTDPYDSDSCLRVTSAVRARGELRLTWDSEIGIHYQVEYSTSLRADAWQVITSAPVESGSGSASFVDRDLARVSGDVGFYRVRVVVD